MIETKVMLSDIGGYPEEKEEAKKLIAILKNFSEYAKQGAYVPKGLILAGEPGVGKTLFAKAIANESGVPFFEFDDSSDSDAKRTKAMKDVFAKAKAQAPAIIFIDELDELAPSDVFVSDISQKTLKILLSEIDGLHNSDGILVIATTNARASLPEALTRSGRMDKKITFELPDLSSREAIFKIYLDKSPLSQGINPKALASKTNGFSGADIKTLINNAIMAGVAHKQARLTSDDIEEGIPEIRFKDIKKNRSSGISESTLYHEIGHALVAYRLKGVIGDISCERYGSVGGSVSFNEEPTSLPADNLPAKERLKDVVVALGGLAGESVFLHDNFCDSGSDLLEARTTLALLMASGYFGFDYMPGRVRAMQTRSMSMDPNCSAARSEKIEAKETELLTSSLKQAETILEGDKVLALKLYDHLKNQGKLSKNEVETLVQEKAA